jgi:hypothetical protein
VNGTGFAVVATGPLLALSNVGTAPAQHSVPASHQTVAYNWWKGTREQRHYYPSIRPRVWGSSFGEPITSLHWVYWRQNTAKGHGLLVHMSCQPCHETIYLHDARTSHGRRYFEKARETGPYTVNLHWTGSAWTG